MENNINKQNKLNLMVEEKSYMKKFLLFGMFLWILVFSFHNVFAVQQTELVNYPFESTAGTTIFDSSGNNYNSIAINGATFVTTNVLFGTRVLFCDGINDYTSSINAITLPETISTSIWFRPTAVTGNPHLWGIGNTNEFLMLEYDGTASNLILHYLNSSGSSQDSIIENVVLPTNTWANIIINFNRTSGRYDYYRDGVLKTLNGQLLNGYKYNSTESKTLVLCNGVVMETTNYFSGRMDSFRLFNFRLNTTQVSSLFTTDSITYEIDTTLNNTNNQTTPVSTLVKTNLISSINLVTPSTSNKVRDLYVTLNNISTSCEIYFDYELYDTSSDLLSFKSSKEFEFGNHSYYLYCEKNVNNVKYYDITNVTNFAVTQGNKAIEFYFLDQNSERLFGEDWYLATPCFPMGANNKYWDFDEDHYVKNLRDGYVQFNLSYTADYDFCLYRGTINTDESEDKPTRKIEVLNLAKTIKLGTIFIGMNTTSYTLNLDNQDKYNVYEPSFWGKTYENLFSFIWGLVIGALMIVLGLVAKSDKLVLVGGLVILAGFGVSTFTLLGVLF